MMTRKQVEAILLQDTLTHLHEKDVNALFHDRLEKAAGIIQAGNITRLENGISLVQGSRPDPYEVNGNCQCEDYTLKQAPKDWCKHRLAAKMLQIITNEVEKMRMQGIAHQHFTCGHLEPLEPCFEVGCMDTLDQQCADCTERRSAFMSETDLTDHGYTLSPNGSTSPAELAVLAAPPYECNPSKGRKNRTKQAPPSVPMPEAPASLNIKLKIPKGGEIMYTMRSMRRGQAGDEELAERLPAVLTWLNAQVERLEQPR